MVSLLHLFMLKQSADLFIQCCHPQVITPLAVFRLCVLGIYTRLRRLGTIAIAIAVAIAVTGIGTRIGTSIGTAAKSISESEPPSLKVVD